ncbi:unnamed protein product [Bursaphelenchus xylophilus]|uniref:(pine wood nematode) hypothetical protein n=1 Tax=Bursaphelenchus xylophilus TaxID=6326 RepID=A0A1I7SR44_BURXY|nr:unnamed protein product [Bursaphelenchus xylophilus]CAG9110811.1 unnamed protein product [Bursaphelenchus xylophilus]
MKLLIYWLMLLVMEVECDKETNSTTDPTVTEVDRNRTFFEDVEEYTSGLTPEFKTLLMLAPVESKKKEKSEKRRAKDSDLKAKSEDEGLKELTQHHIEQLLKFYSKVSEKLLAKDGKDKSKQVHYHKMGSKHEDKDDEEGNREYLNYVENWAQQHGEKPTESTYNTVNTNSLPGYGNLNYLNAANYGPPGAGAANNYALALRNRMFGQGYSGPNCCNMCQCGSAFDPACVQNSIPAQTGVQTGCGGYNYGAATDTADPDDGYGPDNYYGGGYGSNKNTKEATNTDLHSHLLNSFTNNPPTVNNNYYQVSGGHNTEPEESKSHFEFAKHHFSSYPQYYGTWNAYQRPNCCGYSNYNVFEPVNDDATDALTTEEPINSKESVFHLVRPNFGSNKGPRLTSKSRKHPKHDKKVAKTTKSPVNLPSVKSTTPGTPNKPANQEKNFIVTTITSPKPKEMSGKSTIPPKLSIPPGNSTKISPPTTTPKPEAQTTSTKV